MLTTNRDSSTASFVSLGFNVKSAMVRNDTMEGEPYIVVPVVMILEGVHNGSNGPIYYSAAELEASVDTWNHKPVVVYHPKNESGKGISACSPAVLTSHKIGVIMNTRFDNKGPVPRLLAEAWLKEERVRKVDDRILTAIENKQMLELSTGLFSENEMVEGEWEGEKYVAIARNYKADHLAILPDQIGACSVADGAGFLRNEINALTKAQGKDLERLREFLVNQIKTASKDKKSTIFEIMSKEPFSLLVENEASHEELRSAIYMALEKKFPPPSADQAGYSYPCIEAVYDDSVIYYMGGKLFKLGYSATSTGVRLNGTPQEVIRATEYRTVSGPTGNAAGRQPTKDKIDTTMNKKELVDGLIANCGYAETDREKLMALPEDTLAMMKKSGETVTANAAKKQEPAKTPVETVVVHNNSNTPAPKSHAEFLASAPAETREIISNAERVLTREKEKHIAVIVANKRNKFTKEQLSKKSIDELETLAELAAEPAQTTNGNQQSNFVGNGMIVRDLPPNATGDDQPLVMERMDFSKARR